MVKMTDVECLYHAVNTAMRGVRYCCIAMSVGTFGLSVAAQDMAPQIMQELAATNLQSSGPAFIHSIESANAALAEAAAERAHIEARYSAEERACHPHFFATSCIDEAKERRRNALSQVRPIEIEANTFKRQARVIERERELEKKQEKAGDKNSRPITSESGIAAAASSRTVLDEGKMPRMELGPPNAKHVERNRSPGSSELKQVEVDDDASARKRAENVAAYQRKVLAAEVRQRRLLIKKAEKERKQLAKDSSQRD